MKSYCTAFALLGLAAPAFAQAPTLKPNPWKLPYPSSTVTGPATQAYIGMFSDDHEADGALLAGGDVFLLYAPARVCSYSKVPGPFASMAKVRLTGCPGAEGLLASTSAGLKLLHWDGTRELAATPVAGSSDWADVVELQVVPGTSGSSDWICALSSSRETVLFAQWDGTYMNRTLGGEFDLARPALTLAALDWDGDNLLDFAFDDGTGVQLRDGQGSEGYLGEIEYAAPRLLRFAHGGVTDDLIWLTQDPGGPGQIVTVIHSSSDDIFEAPIYAGATVIGHLTIADIDGNGFNDLVATRADDHMAQVLYHQDVDPQNSEAMTLGLISPVINAPFDPWGIPNVPDVYDTSLAVPVVAAGDIDGDGDEDLLFAGQPGCADRALVWFGNGIHEETDGAKPVKVWLHTAQYFDWIWPLPAPEPGPGDQAHLVIAPHAKPAGGLVSTANKIRVTVWGRATDTGPITPLYLANDLFDTNLTTITVDIPLPPIGPGQQPPRYLVTQIGYVLVVNNAITQVFPGWTGQIDRTIGIIPPIIDGPTTTGGVNQPPPPPSHPPPIP